MKQSENIIKFILIALFIGCLFKMPYSYYEISRFIGVVGFCILGYKAYLKKDNTNMVVWFASALLINPFIKLALGRAVWNVIDIIWVILLISSFKPKIKKPMSENERARIQAFKNVMERK